MIKRRYKRRYNRGYSIKYKLCVCLILVGIAIVSADLSVRPILNRAVGYQTKLVTTEIITEVATEVLAELELSYDDIVVITKTEDDKISSIQTNITAINFAKAKILNSITKKLNETKNYRYNIPLGTVIGNDYLINRGPLLSFMITPMGHAGGEFNSQFESAGINQTYHRIVLNVVVDTTTLIPLHNSSHTINADFVLAETVIVGNVPDYYTNIQGNDEALKSGIGDFIPKP